jgi:hypothetical protein
MYVKNGDEVSSYDEVKFEDIPKKARTKYMKEGLSINYGQPLK